ncbi:hypothetical protein PR048_026485 [Dryococelus australis]|uniref:Uncharacterized protein n=1 Tax=Dryococelus australis TaxID=614101 RepID=A0ABQ9GLF9_9NEOP|nr:hypothetical protein PR048_026485 [Dryococelus australis]
MQCQSYRTLSFQTDSVPEQDEIEAGQSNSIVPSRWKSVENDHEDFKSFEDSESVEGSIDTDMEDLLGFTGCLTRPQYHLQWWKQGIKE